MQESLESRREKIRKAVAGEILLSRGFTPYESGWINKVVDGIIDDILEVEDRINAEKEKPKTENSNESWN